MSKERPLGQPSSFRDLGHRRVIETPLAVESEGGLFETSPAVGFPSRHYAIVVRVDSD
jgi:hypothetical protein